MNNPSLRLESDSPEISISVRLGLLPVAIIAIAVVASFLMLSNAIGKVQPEQYEVKVNPTPVNITITPAPAPKIVLRPRIVLHEEITVVPTPEQMEELQREKTTKKPSVPASMQGFFAGVGFGEAVTRP